MAVPSVTYTFTNSTTADATEVNQNFTDLVNSLTDGLKDLTISAITCNGAASFNGAVTLGNASGDVIKITGTITDPVIIDGDADEIHFRVQGHSTQTSDIAVFEKSDGTDRVRITNAGHHVIQTPWKVTAGNKEIANAAYAILDADGFDFVYATTVLTAARTVTLPTLADNLGRVITIKKSDTSTYQLLVDGEGAETIDGYADWPLVIGGDFVTVLGETAGWRVIDKATTTVWTSFTPTGSWTGNVTYTGYWRRVGNDLEVTTRVVCSAAPTPGATSLTFTLPLSLSVDTAMIYWAAGPISPRIGDVVCIDAGVNYYQGWAMINNSTSILAMSTNTSGTTAVNDTNPITFGNLDEVLIKYSVPISGWRS